MSQVQAYAEVIVDVSTRALDSAFSYLIPSQLQSEAKVGCCVLVDFANRPVLGYITAIRDQLPEAVNSAKLKPIKDVLSLPYFDQQAAELAQWLSREYLAPLIDTVKLLTPPGSAPKLWRGEDGRWRLVQQDVRPVDERWAALTEAGQDFRPKANAVKQRAIIEALRISEMRVADLALEISNPAAPLKSLADKGIIQLQTRRRIRGSQPPLPASKAIINLTEGQVQALDAINAALDDVEKSGAPPPSSTPRPILLDGVTGSGKTEVYLQAISRVLAAGGSAIVLVPEISLTPQTVARFRSRFGEQVAVLHSRLSAGERYDQWDLLRQGRAKVAVGARSALFAPLSDLKLIIIDEEHEGSYKQGSAPRYLTRDVAAKLAKLRQALLLLGSATPSLESLHAAQTGEYQRVELPQRASGKPLPPIQVVDLSQQFKSGNKTMFSLPLRTALLKTIERREKAVLLLNRRGFASFLLCRDCGFVPTCASCVTSFTYHTNPPRLLCHHCGSEQPVPPACPECGSVYLKQLGPGTQFASEQLRSLLPDGTPIIRMDADTTRGKSGHERCLDQFIAADFGVLLGTQMIAKGLDFPEVTLVGVLIADTSLKFPDFRAPERTWQLLEQVSGRAGRALKDGQVIVQTYWPEHSAIRAVAAHDRELLLAEERTLRQEIGYPPYTRLANILIWGESLPAVTTEAIKLAESLDSIIVKSKISGNCAAPSNDGGSQPPGIQILGPSPCVLAKRQNNHRWHILVKAPRNFDLPSLLAPALRQRKAPPGVNIAIDIDPYDLM